MKVKESKIVLIMFAVAILWGMGFIGTDIALDNGLSPAVITVLRFAIGAFLIGIIFFKDIIKSTKKEILNSGIAGLVLAIGFLLQSTAQVYTSIGNNAFITATNVVITPLLAYIFLKEKVKPKVLVGAIFSLCGIGLLSYSNLTIGKVNIGDGLALVCAFFFALHFIILSKIMKNSKMSVIAFWQMVFVAIFSLIYGLIFDFSSIANMQINLKGGLAILFLGVFPTAICYCGQSYSQKHISPSKASLVLGTESLWATIISVAMGRDEFTFYLLGGGILIMFSILLVEIDVKGIFSKITTKIQKKKEFKKAKNNSK